MTIPNSEKERYSQREILRRVEDELKAQGELLARLNNALVGDKDLEIPGLFTRVHKVERAQQNQKLWYTLIATISSGIAIGMTYLKEFFTQKPH